MARQGDACRLAMRRLARELGVKAIKFRPDGRVETGTPDVLGCLPPSGRMIALERKRKDEKITPLQAKRLREWAAVGAIVGVFEDADDAIEVVLSQCPVRDEGGGPGGAIPPCPVRG